MSRQGNIWVSLVLGLLAVAGWTLHWHVIINNNTTTRPAVSQKDGKLWTAQCMTIKRGTTEQQIVSLYGMPQGDNQVDGSTDLDLPYPLGEDPSKNCTITFDGDGKVDQVQLDLVGFNLN